MAPTAASASKRPGTAGSQPRRSQSPQANGASSPSARGRSGSPPAAISASARLLRPTAASRGKSEDAAAADAAAEPPLPPSVATVAAMSPSERVRAEFAARKAAAPKVASAAFGGKPHTSPQRARADTRKAALYEHRVRDAETRSPNLRHPVSFRNAPKPGAGEAGAAPVAQVPAVVAWSAATDAPPTSARGSAWAKSGTPRMGYQFPWSSFPQATPQPSLLRAQAPPVGRYGGSTSFAVKGWGGSA